MPDYTILSFPRSRLATMDMGYLARQGHRVMGLLEVDMTDSLDRIQTLDSCGRRVGLTSWVVKCISEALKADMSMNAVNWIGRRQVRFSKINVAVAVEREVDGKKVPLAGLIQDAGSLSVHEIQDSIMGLKRVSIDSSSDYVLGQAGMKFATSLYFHMPTCLRRGSMKLLLSVPWLHQKTMGTVMVTSLAGRSSVSGWIIPESIHGIAIAIGSISKKPWAVDGTIAIRDILHLTLVVDHDVVDGAPAAAFASRLVALLETGRLPEQIR